MSDEKALPERSEGETIHMSRSRARCLRLLLEPNLAELEKARGMVDQIRQIAGLSEGRAFDMKVALCEACANGIEHARSRVQIICWLLSDRILVEVTNDGWLLPGLREDGDRRHRGLGLPLMAALADDIHVSQLARGLSRVSLTFFLSPKALELPARAPERFLGGQEPSERAFAAAPWGRSDGQAGVFEDVAPSTQELSHFREMADVIEEVCAAATLPGAAAALLDGAILLTRCQGGMLRMRESVGRKSAWLPALVHRGLPETFLREEALIRTDECMCGRVCVGLTDPSLAFFTPRGSFVWGKAQTIEEEFGREALGEVRGRCIAEGFESIGVFPLATDKGPIGALHLADLEKDKFQETAGALEWGCRVCGPIMQKAGHAKRRAAVREAVATLKTS